MYFLQTQYGLIELTLHGELQHGPQVQGPPDSLRSDNGRFEFVFQSDGNAVVYETANRRVVWHSNTTEIQGHDWHLIITAICPFGLEARFTGQRNNSFWDGLCIADDPL